jgi:hypothetical protein
MNVKFTAYGLHFEAEAEYYPIIPAKISGPPEDCYPEEGGEIEIHSLKCGGHEATFMLESDILSEVIFDEAALAAEELVQQERQCGPDDGGLFIA